MVWVVTVIAVAAVFGVVALRGSPFDGLVEIARFAI
jgi:hypothetical protein